MGLGFRRPPVGPPVGPPLFGVAGFVFGPSPGFGGPGLGFRRRSRGVVAASGRSASALALPSEMLTFLSWPKRAAGAKALHGVCRPCVLPEAPMPKTKFFHREALPLDREYSPRRQRLRRSFGSRFCQDRKVIISLCHLALFWPRQGWGSRASEKCTFLGLGIAQRNAYFSVLATTGGGRHNSTRSLPTMRAARGANA